MTNGRNSWKRKQARTRRAARFLQWTQSPAAITAQRPQIGILQLYISTTCIMVALPTFRIKACKEKKCVKLRATRRDADAALF